MQTARPRDRLVRRGGWLALLAMVWASGLHWVALQGLAYSSMLVRYAREAPLSVAVAQTFDGQHPCPLCHAVQDGRQQEEDQRNRFKSNPRWELALPGCPLRLPVWNLPALDLPLRAEPRWHSRAEAPPKPRPRPG